MPKYDVFLSHNSDDKGSVELIARRLQAEGGLNPFLDKWHLIPGEPWQEALEEALTISATVAVFIGPSGISPWHNVQVRSALDNAVRTRNEYRVIPVFLPGATEEAVTGFLAQRTWVDFRVGLEDAIAFHQLVCGILGHPPEDSGRFTLPDEPAPYPGLKSFARTQAAYFFGRTQEWDRLLVMIRQSPLVAVVGASGSGKSSLVRAGLLPTLEAGWHAVTMTPGDRPVRALADQLALFHPETEHLTWADSYEKRLLEQTDGLSTALSTLLASRPEIKTLLLVIDQFEELLTQIPGSTQTSNRQQTQFIANLVDTIEASGGKVRAILTLRLDFFQHRLSNFAALESLLADNLFLLRPLGETGLREAIVKPAQLVGAMLEKGLVARLIADTHDQPGAMPLLSFTLNQLWQYRQGYWLTHAAYDQIGGVAGALNQRAEEIYQALSDSQQQLAHNLFIRLVAFNEEIQDTRRRLWRAELQFSGVRPEIVDHLIAHLSQPSVRLIITDGDLIDLAHEAIIEQWQRLRDWLAQDREALLIQRDLTEVAKRWRDHDCDPAYLYQGSRLSAVELWARDHGDALNLDEQEFLSKSHKVHNRARMVRAVLAGAAVLFLIFLSVAMFTEWGPFAPQIVIQAGADLDAYEVISFDWMEDGTAYVGLGSQDMISSLKNLVVRQTPEGAWEYLNLEGVAASVLVIDPTRPGVIYVGLEGEGLGRSLDYGQSWQTVGQGLPAKFIQSIAVSPTGELYTGDYIAAEGVYVSRDQGNTWQRLPGSPETNVQAILWAHEQLLVGSGRGMWGWDSSGGWRSVLEHGSILALIETPDRIIFGGSNGIYELLPNAAPVKISNEPVKTIGMNGATPPFLLAATKGERLLLWQLGSQQMQLDTITEDVEERIPFIYTIHAPSREPELFWIGTDTGLKVAAIKRWFEF